MNSPQEMLKKPLFGMSGRHASTMSQASTRCSSRASNTPGPSPEYVLRSPALASDLDIMSEEDEDLLSSDDDAFEEEESFGSLSRLDERAGDMEHNQDSIDTKMERLLRLEQLMASVHELQAVDQALDQLIERVNRPRTSKKSYSKELMLEVRLAVMAHEDKVPTPRAPPAPKPQVEVPAGWQRKESGKYPGRFYYVNKKTGETTWKLPKAVEEEEPREQPRVVVGAPPGLSMPSFQPMALQPENYYGGYGYDYGASMYCNMPQCAMAA